MKLTPVESSTVVGYHYNKATQTLIIEFKRTGRYQYENVTEDSMKLILANSSVSKALVDYVKKKPFTKL